MKPYLHETQKQHRPHWLILLLLFLISDNSLAIFFQLVFVGALIALSLSYWSINLHAVIRFVFLHAFGVDIGL